MKKILVVWALVIVGILGASARVETPPAPRPAKLVNDFAGLLTPVQQQQIETTLQTFAKQTSTQIAVVTMDNLAGYTPVEMASGLIDNWGIGQKGKDNGVVILLKPRNSTKGEVFIGTGRGMEGVLPDGKVGRLIDAVMMQHLAKGDFYTAITNATGAIMDISQGEYTIDDVARKDSLTPIIIIIVIFIAVFIYASITKGGIGPGFVYMLWILSAIARSRGGGGGGGFGGGSSGGGGAGRSF